MLDESDLSFRSLFDFDFDFDFNFIFNFFLVVFEWLIDGCLGQIAGFDCLSVEYRDILFFLD